LEKGALVALLTLLVFIVFGGVLIRYTPFPGQTLWTVELGRLVLLWVSFLAAAQVQREGLHFEFTAVLAHTTGKSHVALQLFIDIVVLISFVLFAVGVYRFCGNAVGLNTYTLHWPQVLYPLSLAVGITLMTIYALVALIRHTKEAERR